jgi:hypothetical protein
MVVTANPVPWTIEIVDDDERHGFEYVRLVGQASLNAAEWFTKKKTL